ncbi:MAG TPA: response regulator [Woeseiaceae bacterium]
MRKSALIVDDSRSARLVLKRMLEIHDLDIATAESAEEALDYLTVHRPDVIFMDHLMPGMDGFEAVSAIKKNPATATIPIMMYTSQKGEVYVGQARALGAVGVLPKEVGPVEVSKVLASLRVIGEHTDREREAASAGERPNGTEWPELERFDKDLRELIGDLFAQQRAVIRRDLLDSYETIARRVADEMRGPGAVEEPPAAPGRDALPLPLRIAVLVLTVASVGFAWAYWQREQAYSRARAENAGLVAAMERLQTAQAEAAPAIEDASTAPPRPRPGEATLDAIAWAMNQSAPYGFDEFPLDDRRVTLLEGLTSRLLDMGFEGEVLVETHVGDFCMVAGEEGFELAPAGLDAGDCDQLGYAPGEAFELGLRQSVAFANFLGTAEEATQGRIRYVITSLGNAEPAVPYPPVASGASAGMWNAAARANNRVEITLLPAR